MLLLVGGILLAKTTWLGLLCACIGAVGLITAVLFGTLPCCGAVRANR